MRSLIFLNSDSVLLHGVSSNICFHVEFAPVVFAKALANPHYLIWLIALLTKDQRSGAVNAFTGGLKFGSVLSLNFDRCLVARKLAFGKLAQPRQRKSSPHVWRV